jgi:glucosamine kinase
MKNIYIGIDGGGTKTKAIATDENFKLIGSGFGGPANIRLSVSESWKSIYTAINEALKKSSIRLEDKNYAFHTGMGLAGVTILKARKEFLETPHPFKTLLLESDAHIGCLAVHDGNDGAIISVGTGVIGYLIEGGSNYRVGGWGFPHADLGGGAWLGLEAAKLTFKAADGIIESSQMLKSIFAKFNNSLPDFCTWACAAKSSDFATLAPFAVEYAQQGDKYARELIRGAAVEIDGMYKALNKKSRNSSQKIKCALLGGLGKLLYPNIQEKQSIFIPDISKTAELGAIYMIQQKLSLSFHKITN